MDLLSPKHSDSPMRIVCYATRHCITEHLLTRKQHIAMRNVFCVALGGKIALPGTNNVKTR